MFLLVRVLSTAHTRSCLDAVLSQGTCDRYAMGPTGAITAACGLHHRLVTFYIHIFSFIYSAIHFQRRGHVMAAGWLLFMVFCGAGLVALPLDMIREFLGRPKSTITKSEYMTRAKALGNKAKRIVVSPPITTTCKQEASCSACKGFFFCPAKSPSPWCHDIC